VEGECVLRKVAFEVQRVEGLRRTRSLSDGGRIGFWAGLPQAVSKKLRPSQQTTQSRMGTVQGVRVSSKLRFTKGAYTKRERVCQLREKGTPALDRRAGVPLSLNATGLGDYRRWLSSIESSDVYPKRYGLWLGMVYIGRFTA
jgi:hypothetical protein